MGRERAETSWLGSHLFPPLLNLDIDPGAERSLKSYSLRTKQVSDRLILPDLERQ